MNYYRGLLHRELGKRAPRVPVLQTLARHFTVALTATAGCHVGLGRDDRATGEIDAKVDDLRAAARYVFRTTVGTDPGRFLAPGMAALDVTLDTLTEVYRQAAFAGVVDGSCLLTSSGLFEELRSKVGRARDPRFRKRRTFTAWRRDLLDAAAMVEDVNRVTTLSSFINSAGNGGVIVTDVLRHIRSELSSRATSGAEFYLFVPS